MTFFSSLSQSRLFSHSEFGDFVMSENCKVHVLGGRSVVWSCKFHLSIFTSSANVYAGKATNMKALVNTRKDSLNIISCCSFWFIVNMKKNIWNFNQIYSVINFWHFFLLCLSLGEIIKAWEAEKLVNVVCRIYCSPRDTGWSWHTNIFSSSLVTTQRRGDDFQ